MVSFNKTKLFPPPFRHPYSPINVGYRYRFRAPNHDTYEVSGVNFTTEKLENFQWNYMDHYICTRGDFELTLNENLKYWRFRTYLLPKEHPAMKKILEGKSTRCDIYTEVPLTDSWRQQIDDFLRYVERDLNKFKGKKPKVGRGGACSCKQGMEIVFGDFWPSYAICIFVLMIASLIYREVRRNNSNRI